MLDRKTKRSFIQLCGIALVGGSLGIGCDADDDVGPAIESRMMAPPIADASACPADSEAYGVWGTCYWGPPTITKTDENEWEGTPSCRHLSEFPAGTDTNLVPHYAGCDARFSVHCSADALSDAEVACDPDTVGDAESCGPAKQYFRTGTHFVRFDSLSTKAACEQFIQGQSCSDFLPYPFVPSAETACGRPDVKPVPTRIAITCCDEPDDTSTSDATGDASGFDDEGADDTDLPTPLPPDGYPFPIPAQ